MLFNSEQTETQTQQNEEQEGGGRHVRLRPTLIVVVPRLFPNSGAVTLFDTHVFIIRWAHLLLLSWLLSYIW